MFKNGNTETLLSPESDYRFMFGLCYDRTLKDPFHYMLMDCAMLLRETLAALRKWTQLYLSVSSYAHDALEKNNNNVRGEFDAWL